MFAYFSSVRLFNVLLLFFSTSILFIYLRQSSWYSRQMFVHIRIVRLQNIFSHVSHKIRRVYEQDGNGQNVRKVSVQTKTERIIYLFGFVYIKTNSRHSSKVASSLFGVSVLSFFLSSITFFRSYFICAYFFFSPHTSYNV